MFGSSWANPQQNQQQQAQQTGAFGQPSAFGATTNNAFGSGSAFGQQPQQQNQQQGQPQVNPMFGGLTTTPSTTTNTGGFGAFSGQSNANTGVFGAKPAGGFGAFGGGTGAFGGGGTTSAFGQTAATPAQPTTSVFGQAAAPATSNAFGTTNLFGGNKTFGTTTGTTGSSFPVVTQGTSNPQFTSTAEKDGTTTLQFQTISCMPQYIGYSFEELRAQDYAQNRKTAAASASAFGQSAFGAAQPATTNLFGQQQPAQQQPTSLFGNPAATNTNTGFGAFGQPAAQPAAAPTNSIFGGGAFGQTQPQQQTGAFGSGTGAFGQTQQPQQQQQQQQQGSIFGGGGAFGAAAANKPAFGAFGGAGGTTGAFGTTPATTSAFGAQTQQQPAQGTGIFGTTPANNTSAFGGTGAFGAAAAKPSIFGTPTTTQTNPSPFGAFGAATQQPQQQQQQQPQQTSIFSGGGGIFGAQQPAQQNQQVAQPSLFGGAQQTTTPSVFGNTNPGGGLFGNNQQQLQQQQQQQQQQQGQQPQGGLFGNMFAKPAQPAGTGLFGNLGQSQANTGQPQQTSLFGNTFGQSNQAGSLFGNKTAAPTLGTSLSGSQNMSGSLFGGNTSVGQAPSLTASINQPIGENLPIFSVLPPGPRIVDLEASAPKKKAGFFLDMPTRSPVPRAALSGYTPANSKLRGFGTSLASSNGGSTPVSFTSGRVGALSISNVNGMSQSVGPDFLGRSGSPALGSGGRQSVKKVILEKKIEPTELFVKSGSPGSLRTGKIVFSPALSQASREKDAEQAAAPQVQDSPTPAPRTHQQRSPNTFASPKPKDKEAPAAAAEDPKAKTTEPAEGDYWMNPDLQKLKKAGYDQLSGFVGLVVGRKGYGEIQFLEAVDLTGLPKLSALLGEVVRFDDKECSVYPDSEDVDKPSPGSGLNVKAKLSLERCWAVDKATREPITDASHPSAIKHLKRLKNMKDTHFESFDIKTGTWTFTVDHF